MNAQLKDITTPPAAMTFENGIKHPDLWLWDSWTCQIGKQLNLYCLAMPRIDVRGEAILPEHRNNHRFHVRRFASEDNGATWTDFGSVQTPSQLEDRSDSRNVWSGSVTQLGDGRVLYGFTGIMECADNRPFVQSICVGSADSIDDEIKIQSTSISSSLFQYDEIITAGYYLGPKPTLGDGLGEEGGPILAWRDPFAIQDGEGVIHLYWSAKVGPDRPAIARATLEERDNGFQVKTLFPPVCLPDSELVTQAEVPKVYPLGDTGSYLLVISACDSRYEGQPVDEITKVQRFYISEDLNGPWRSYSTDGSLVPGCEFLFGGSVTQYNADRHSVNFIAPYTEMANDDVQLSFGPIIEIPLK